MSTVKESMYFPREFFLARSSKFVALLKAGH